MFRKALGIMMVAMLLSGLGAAGCGGGYSDSKAEIRCQQEKVGKSQCFTDAVYDGCLACYKECGDQCTPQNVCPETYECE